VPGSAHFSSLQELPVVVGSFCVVAEHCVGLLQELQRRKKKEAQEENSNDLHSLGLFYDHCVCLQKDVFLQDRNQKREARIL